MTTLSELHAAARDRGPRRTTAASVRAELEAALGAAPAPRRRAVAPPVRLERDGPLALIIARRSGHPQRDRLGRDGLPWRRSWASSRRDPDVRLVAVTGAGRTFSSGAAIREFDPLDDGGDAAHRPRHASCSTASRTLPVPTVALVNGHAVGGGAEVALACDWRIIAPDAELRFVHASIGLVPGFGGLGRLRADGRRDDGAAPAGDVRVGRRPARRRARAGGGGGAAGRAALPRLEARAARRRQSIGARSRRSRPRSPTALARRSARRSSPAGRTGGSRRTRSA